MKEHAALPDLNVKSVIAKIDTGATLASIDAADIKIITRNNAKLNDAVDQQQAVIEQQLKDIEQIQTINLQLTQTNTKLTADLQLAEEKFNKVNASGERRDIGNLALNKPKSIERIERKREQQRARCFEIAQGSPLTEEELNATKKSQINAECTNLANPNYIPY